jgi:hypothetical protein
LSIPSCFTTSINHSKVGWLIERLINKPHIQMMMSIEDLTTMSQSLLSLPTLELELGSLPLLVPMVVKRIDLTGQSTGYSYAYSLVKEIFIQKQLHLCRPRYMTQ